MNGSRSRHMIIVAAEFRSDCARNMVIDYRLSEPVSVGLMNRLVPVGLVVNRFSERVAGASDHASGPLGGGDGRVSAMLGSDMITVTFGCLVRRASPEAVQRFETELLSAR